MPLVSSVCALLLALLTPFMLAHAEPKPLNPDLLVASPKSQPLRVLVTIQPIALLVQDLAGDMVELDVLLEAGDDPHHMHLRPSHMKKIEAADLLISISDEFEPWLESLSHKVNSHLRLNSHSHGHNQHIWLNPEQILHMAMQISEQLRELRPEAATQFDWNQHEFSKLWQLEQEKWKNWVSEQDVANFVANHESWEHFYEFYGLQPPFYLFEHESTSIGARKKAELQQWLNENPDGCLLKEPGEGSRAAAELEKQLRVIEVNPLAVGLKAETYFTDFYQQMLAAILTCPVAEKPKQ